MKIGVVSWRAPIGRMFLAVAAVAALAAGRAQPKVVPSHIDIAGPPGSGAFGTSVTVLPNGNLVVTDPFYDAGATVDVGAVYLYDGATGTLISVLTGSTAGDQVGSPGVTVLSNGSYVVSSRFWHNGAAAAAGAVTWASATTGVSGVVSAANSLVGSTADDRVGYACDTVGVIPLSSGNYLARSPRWDNAALGAVNAGAVTWGSGTTGVSGVVSAANSLVGTTTEDRVGQTLVTLADGDNHVVHSPFWDNALLGAVDAGAVTWGSGSAGVCGEVSEANSLVGTSSGDRIGVLVEPLSSGSYLVISPWWDNAALGATDAGAVTWGSGMSGIAGGVSAANSLVGSTAYDTVGYDLNYAATVTELSSGSYVVRSPNWDNAAVGAADAGAVTWGSGSTGIKGVVSAENSLVGSTAGDQIGFLGHGIAALTELSDGDYVVSSRWWDNTPLGASDAGAVTWGRGTTGITGTVSASNSLVGSTAGDQVGYIEGWGTGVTALRSGSYLVRSPGWDAIAVGAADAGAVTWGSGTTGLNGVVSAANSLVGSTSGDRVGVAGDGQGVTELSNGSYVVSSPWWDNAGLGAADAGAVTWGSGTTSIAGVVSAANSLVGSTAGDRVGCAGDSCERGGVTALSNGNYVVNSPWWDHAALGATDAGAATWGSGTAGASGVVSATNSLVGSTSGDRVGCAGDGCEYSGVTALTNGNYVVSSPGWDNAARGASDAGAATWGSGTDGIIGVVSVANSLVGSTAGDEVGFFGVAVLHNGNYVVRSPNWDNSLVAATDAGAVTWGSGTEGIAGEVSAENSLVGTTAGDRAGTEVDTLSNGDYLVLSPWWDNAAVGTAEAGAVTWGSGTTGICGVVSATNSLVGTSIGDQVGYAYDGQDVMELSNGDYLVLSPWWDNAALGATEAGAVTWGSGATGVAGAVSAANSLVGSTTGDRVGCADSTCQLSGLTALSDGGYVAVSTNWDNGVAANAGAVTWSGGPTGVVGSIAAENSVRGTSPDGGASMIWVHNPAYPATQLVVGRPADNIVTLFGVAPPRVVFLPVVLKSTP